MTNDEIESHFVFNVLSSDPVLKQECKEMDSVENLNRSPISVRIAGYRAMRRAFLLGAQWAESKKQ